MLLNHVLETNNLQPNLRNCLLSSFVRHTGKKYFWQTSQFLTNEDFQQVLVSLEDKTKVIVRENS
jgi:hypothetical protein